MANERSAGALLRQWRTERGWSLGRLSARCGVHKSTLSRWESGRTHPSETELAAAMDALEVPPAGRALLLALIPAPRAVRMQDALSASAGLDDARFPPGSALLRALRGRAGLSIHQVAEVLSIHPTAVSHWERSVSLPARDRLERLFGLYEALPEERRILSGEGRWWDESEEGEPHHPDAELALRLVPIVARAWSGDHHLMDLQFLTLEEYCWRAIVGGRPDWTREKLAEVYHWHATWLLWRDRPAEANRYARRALELSEGLSPLIWVVAASGNGAAEGKLDLLRRWFPRVSPRDQVWMYKAMAGHASEAGRHGTALSFIEEQRKAAAVLDDYWTDRNVGWTRARVLLNAGRPQEALDAMPDGDQPHFHQQIEESLFRSRAFRAVGDEKSAQLHARHVYDSMIRFQLWVPEALPLLQLL